MPPFGNAVRRAPAACLIAVPKDVSWKPRSNGDSRTSSHDNNHAETAAEGLLLGGGGRHLSHKDMDQMNDHKLDEITDKVMFEGLTN